MPYRLSDSHVEGGPAQPVYITNKLDGDPSGGGNVSIVSGTKAVAGNNTLIAAPGSGKRIVVYTFVVQNESATATTIILKDHVDRWRVLGQNQGDGLSIAFDALQPWKLNENAALTMNLSGANSCGYSIQYAIEDV